MQRATRRPLRAGPGIALAAVIPLGGDARGPEVFRFLKCLAMIIDTPWMAALRCADTPLLAY
jgi:hypothetical protein